MQLIKCIILHCPTFQKSWKTCTAVMTVALYIAPCTSANTTSNIHTRLHPPPTFRPHLHNPHPGLLTHEQAGQSSHERGENMATGGLKVLSASLKTKRNIPVPIKV